MLESPGAPPVKLMWQNVSSGERSLWLMQGTSWDGTAVLLPQVPTAWSMAGSADFNADGNADIVWQNLTTGDRSIWFMSGNSYASAALLPNVPIAWSIAGVGDFNSDGKPDIVWQNTITGERSIWFMNGSTYSSAALLPQVPTVWSIAAVGDFNADGKPDLVWQNTATGERSIWFMNGAALSGAALLPTVPVQWRIAAATDFDGDSKPDLVWQNTSTGERSIWIMNGPNYSSAVLLPTVPTAWGIAGVLSTGGQGCPVASALQLAVGEVHPLTASERSSLCIGGGTAATEYTLIPFNGTTVATTITPVEVAGTNTVAIQSGGLASLQVPQTTPWKLGSPRKPSLEWQFRTNEIRELSPLLAESRQKTLLHQGAIKPRALIGIPSVPVVGSTYQLNSGLSGGFCAGTPRMTDAKVVAVLPHTIVLSDVTSPPGGYSDAEMTAFGQTFDTLIYALDVSNFGTPSDADGNGRIAIYFTPGVNVLATADFVTDGLFDARDLFTAASCSGSNEGEMFYVAVPDPNMVFNSHFTDKAYETKEVALILVHEFQHLINAGRRIYFNDAPNFEQVWLNEALSHVAEELLYYRISGNSPRTNIDIARLRSSQAQLDAFNDYQVDDFLVLGDYLRSPETNSPFDPIETYAMTGASWQLLRYAADQRGGLEANTWFALVNTTLDGAANFNNVFGDLVASTRNWAVAQYVDDAGLGVASVYTNPSWNFRSIFPAISLYGGKFPLLTHALVAAPLSVTLNGGSASYVRFGVAANVPATIRVTSGGEPVPSALNFMLVRTR